MYNALRRRAHRARLWFGCGGWRRDSGRVGDYVTRAMRTEDRGSTVAALDSRWAGGKEPGHLSVRLRKPILYGSC